MTRTAGSLKKPGTKTPIAELVEAERPDLPEVEPLYATYDQPKPEGAYFDEQAADHAVDWIEGTVRHYKGRWAGQPFYLLAWQRRLVRELFGWKQVDGARLYRVCYVEAPRKSGKSALASAIACYLAYGDDENGPHVYFAASDRYQAGITYNGSRLMVESSPELDARTRVYSSRKEMEIVDDPAALLKCLSGETTGKLGGDLHGLIFDELAEQTNREFFDVLTTSMGAREQPVTFMISTAGWDTNSVCYEQREHTRQTAEGATHDPSFLGVVFGLDDDEDWLDEANWPRANPSLGAITQPEYYREKARRAATMPTEQNAFRVLFLDQWVGQAVRWMPMDAWDACDMKPARPSKQTYAFGGLDLSVTTDLTAFVVVTERDGALEVHLRAWLPAANLRDRIRNDRVPYDVWAEAGFLELVPGPVIDYAYPRAAILEAAEAFKLRDVGYDRWNSSQIVQELEAEGVKMVQVGQGYASLSAPTKEILRLTLEKKIKHGGNPLLRWAMNNVAVQQDSAGNIKPDKEKSRHRIDPAFALAMAVDGWQRRGFKRVSVYETRGMATA